TCIDGSRGRDHVRGGQGIAPDPPARATEPARLGRSGGRAAVMSSGVLPTFAPPSLLGLQWPRPCRGFRSAHRSPVVPPPHSSGFRRCLARLPRRPPTPPSPPASSARTATGTSVPG